MANEKKKKKKKKEKKKTKFMYPCYNTACYFASTFSHFKMSILVVCVFLLTDTKRFCIGAECSSAPLF